MKEELLKIIKNAILISNPEMDISTISNDTKFLEIPNMDSMSIVNFQLDLVGIIGDKANEALPVPEMTIDEYAELLASL